MFAVNNDANSRDKNGIQNMIPAEDRTFKDNISKNVDYEVV